MSTFSLPTSNNRTIEISFEEAIKDSPQFRCNIAAIEEEIDNFTRWMDNFELQIKAYVEDCASNLINSELNESVSKLGKKQKLETPFVSRSQ